MGFALFGVATRILIASFVASAAIPAAAVGVLVVLHAVTVCRAFKGLRRAAPAPDDRRGCRSRGEGLSPDELERLPSFGFREINAKKESVSTNCTICLECFRTGDRCRLLPPCGHSFHATCADSWLQVNPLCPLCRASAAPVAADDHRRSCL